MRRTGPLAALAGGGLGVWPPRLQDLKDDLGHADNRDDVALTSVLDAAVAFVERVHRSRFDFGDADADLPLPLPPHSIWLGTIRLAGRWYIRRRSPDGLLDWVCWVRRASRPSTRTSTGYSGSAATPTP